MLLKTNKKGFTLVESIIAITIIVLAAAAILPLVLYSSQTTYSNQNLITANNLASSVMEEIRSFDFESIGTVGGNPEGTIEQEQTRTLNGYDYDIYTTISWASAQHKNDEINQVAYKNIRIIVKGKNMHSNAEGVTLAELHSIAARDGEEPLIEEGHLKVSILDANSSPVYEGISVRIEGAGSPTQTQNIDDFGQAFFGMLDQGNYSVTITIPNDMFDIGGDVYDPESNTIVKENVYVANYATTEIEFYVDYEDNAGGLELQFIDKAKNTPIVRAGAITIELDFGGTNNSITKQFTKEDFIDGVLPKEFLGALPVGAEITDINVTDILGYKNYKIDPDSGEALKTADGTTWSGIISKPHEKVLIPLGSGYFFEEGLEEGFEYYHDMSDTLYVNEDGYLSLMSYIGISSDAFKPISSSESGKDTIEKAFDGDLSTYWKIGNHKIENFISIAFNETTILNELTIHAIKNHGPKEYFIEFFNDGAGEPHTTKSGNFGEWHNQGSSQTIEFNPLVSCDQFKITFKSWYTTGNNSRINDIELYSNERKSYRIVGPLDISAYEIAPYLKVLWEVTDIPDGVSFEVGFLLLDKGTQPSESDFTDDTIVAESGGIIPNIYGQPVANKTLWLLERVTSTQKHEASPILKYLYIEELYEE